VVGLDAEIPLPNEDPFDLEEAACRVDRDPGRATIVRNTGSRAPAKGSLHLRLRDLDLADVFQVLHLMTNQAYLVDEDVHGRVSLDLAGVDGEQALAALEKTGIALSAPGSLRRVATSRPKDPPAPGAAADVPRVTLSLKRATVRDVLAVMAEAHPPLAAMAPAGPLGRISLWTREAPATDVRAAVLQAAGLDERIAEEGRLLERAGGNAETLTPVAGAGVSRRLAMHADELAVEEFVLAGIALSAERRLAFAYSPTGALYAYAAGDRLANGLVQAIESTDVLLSTEEGPLRLVLPDLPR
jgi:hypothetical protein